MKKTRGQDSLSSTHPCLFPHPSICPHGDLVQMSCLPSLSRIFLFPKPNSSSPCTPYPISLPWKPQAILPITRSQNLLEAEMYTGKSTSHPGWASSSHVAESSMGTSTQSSGSPTVPGQLGHPADSISLCWPGPEQNCAHVTGCGRSQGQVLGSLSMPVPLSPDLWDEEGSPHHRFKK